MSKELSDREKLKVLFDYWLSHNTEHNSENERWLGKVKDLGLERVAEELEAVVIIKTPYKNHAPRQPQPEAEGDFRIIVDERWAAGLYLLEKFKYVNVLFCFDRASKDVPMRVTPPGASKSVGVFASRSPLRPNPIALSTVRIKNISNNTIFISGIDALDGTPLLDLKPYIAAVDCKPDAGNGWVDDMNNTDHQISHLKGESHSH